MVHLETGGYEYGEVLGHVDKRLNSPAPKSTYAKYPPSLILIPVLIYLHTHGFQQKASRRT